MASKEKMAELERQLATTRLELAAARAEAADGRFFRKLVEALNDVVTVLDRDGRATFASASFSEVTGFPQTSIIGHELPTVIHPDDRPRVLAKLKDVLASSSESVHRVEFRRAHADGHWLNVEASGRNLLADPDVRGVVVSTREIGEAVRLREALRDSERMFRSLFDDTSVAVTIRDIKTQRFLDCNAAALRLYGISSRMEMTDTTPLELAPETQPDGRATVDVLREYVQRAVLDGVARMEWVAKRRNGETFPADVHTTVITLEDGRRIMQTMIEDVSERRKAENALRLRARRDDLVNRVSRQFVQSTSDAAMAYALEALGTFLGVSRVRMRRFSEDGSILATIKEWCAPGVPPFPLTRQDATHPVVRWLLGQVERDGWLAVNDTDIAPHEGEPPRPEKQPMRALLVVPMENLGVLTGWVILDHVDRTRRWTDDDISTARLVAEIVAIGLARSEAEARSRRRAARDELLSEVSRRFLDEDPEVATGATLERLGASLEAESVSLFAVDPQGPRLRCTHRWSVRGVDAGFESLEGYPVPPGVLVPVEATSGSTSRAEALESRSAWLEALQRDSGRRLVHAPVGYGGQVFGLLAVRKREGQERTDDESATVRAVAELIAVGRVRKAAELALAKATDEAIAANLTKSAFLANMSHELRTPLNGVIGMVDLLANTPLDERQQRYTETARSSASLLLSVISDILDFSKIEAGKLQFESTPFCVSETVEEVGSILVLGAEEKSLELSCHSDIALASPLIGDPARLRQVLVNLISNAIKFTPRGEVSVQAKIVSDQAGSTLVRFEVRDTGIGIARAAQAKLFQPFTQVDASTTREYGGTGLGLAICRELVQRMGGAIGLESEPGKGSTFWFEVRLAKPTAEGRRAIEPDARLAGLRVLGVDDTANNRELLQAQLTAAGMTCDTASDGFEALRMLHDAARTKPYALAVLDHHMPGLDGRELARRVTADARLRTTRLVMLGSVASPIDVGEQRALGIVGYCTKPIRRKQLLRVLRAALDGESPAERESPPKARAARATPARLLLVEDSDINAEVAGEILRSAGYEYDLATDGAHAVACVKARSYDLILMDCQLPEVDGYEATRRIRALQSSGALPGREKGEPLPVVALTASATREDIERCVAAGMSDHVSKPVDARRLLEVIAGHLGEGTPPKARPSRPSSVPVADLTRALARLSGDRALLRRIGRQFSEGAAAAIAGLRTAVDARAAADIAFAAHRLKGQASTFGGDALIAATETLKETATTGNWTAASASLLAVEREIDRLLRALATDAAI